MGRGISKGDAEGAASEVGRKPREWGVLYVKKVSEWLERLTISNACYKYKLEENGKWPLNLAMWRLLVSLARHLSRVVEVKIWFN